MGACSGLEVGEARDEGGELIGELTSLVNGGMMNARQVARKHGVLAARAVTQQRCEGAQLGRAQILG